MLGDKGDDDLVGHGFLSPIERGTSKEGFQLHKKRDATCTKFSIQRVLVCMKDGRNIVKILTSRPESDVVLHGDHPGRFSKRTIASGVCNGGIQ